MEVQKLAELHLSSIMPKRRAVPEATYKLPIAQRRYPEADFAANAEETGSAHTARVAEVKGIFDSESIPHERIRRGMEELLASTTFVRSNRLSSFLRFAVEGTLLGRESELKEYTIGTMAYGRRENFDPSVDTIVRTEARRLRRKLQEYYEGEGRKDEVIIYLRPGSYVPIFRWRASLGDEQAVPVSAIRELLPTSEDLVVSVSPFQTASSDAAAVCFAFGLSEELIHRLVLLPRLRVLYSAQPGETRDAQRTSLEREGHMRVFLCGSVRSDPQMLRVHARLMTAEGQVLWSQRFDAASNPDALFRMQESVASSFLDGIVQREPLLGLHQRSCVMSPAAQC